MDELRKKIKQFRVVTLGCAMLSSVLWIAAGRIGMATNNPYNFILIGILAVLATMVAVTSARKEGFYGHRYAELMVKDIAGVEEDELH